MNEPRHAWKPKKVLKNSLSVFNEGVWSSKIPEVISNLRNMHTYSWRVSKCTFSKGGISMWLSSAYKKTGPSWSFEMNQLLCIMDSTHIKGAKNTQWAFLKICFFRKKYCCRHKTFPRLALGAPWNTLYGQYALKPLAVSRRYSSCLSLASWVSCPAPQDLLSHCGGKKLSLVTDHIWVWKNQDELEGKKKRKVGVITSQLNINHYRDKRKGAACRNLQEIQVFSDFLPPPLWISRAEEQGPYCHREPLSHHPGGISSHWWAQSRLTMQQRH